MNFKINCHSSISIDDEIFFDPFGIEERKSARIIFITHPHFDHFSEEDINKIVGGGTVFVAPASMKKEFTAKYPSRPAVFVEPYGEYEAGGVRFTAFPAYNVNKKFHPKENRWVGYALSLGGKTVAVTGDTDDTEDLRKIKADVLFVPVGGTYTMTAKEAAEAVRAISPAVVVPTHYGKIVGDKTAGEEFEKLVSDFTDCQILIK